MVKEEYKPVVRFPSYTFLRILTDCFRFARRCIIFFFKGLNGVTLLVASYSGVDRHASRDARRELREPRALLNVVLLGIFLYRFLDLNEW